MRIVAVTTFGLDLGDGSSYFVKRDENMQIVARGKVSTRKAALVRKMKPQPGDRIVLEAGTHSGWVSRAFLEMGCEVVVANPRQVPLLTRSERKSDRRDAELLCQLGQVEPELLEPVSHRELEKQEDLVVIKARDQLIRERTGLVNYVRGTLKQFGIRIRKCSTERFAKVAMDYVPEQLGMALGPVLETIGALSEHIQGMDREIERLCKEKYPETELLMQIRGVGALTALTFVLVVGSPGKFKHNRSMGPLLGLIPKLRQSGNKDPELGITKAGNELLRRLLVNCAHYILGHFGQDSDLRRFGQRLEARGGKVAKKKAVVAVARKLSVLMLLLWRNGEVYEPLYNADQKAA